MADKVMVPATLIGPLIEKLAADRDYEHGRDNNFMSGGMTILQEQTGVPDRTLYDLKSLRRNASLSVVDRILTGTDNEGLAWLPVAEGGFMEYYEENPPPVTKAPNADRLPPSAKPERQKKGTCKDCGVKCSRRAERCWDCRWKSPEQKEQSKDWAKRIKTREGRRSRLLGNIGSDNTARYDSKRPDQVGDINWTGVSDRMSS